MISGHSALQAFTVESDDGASLSWINLEEISVIGRDIPSPDRNLSVINWNTISEDVGHSLSLTSEAGSTSPG